MSLGLSSNLDLNLRLQHGHGEGPSAFSVNLSPSPAFAYFYSKPKAGVLQLNGIKVMARDGRDNLADLHRTSKKRTAPVAPPVGLWDRFPTARTVQQMMETMERMMDDPFAFSNGSGWSPSLIPSEVDGYRRGRTPWEMKEAEGEFKMRFDMPGMTKEDVKVWVEEKMLVVKAQKMSKTQKSVVEEGAEEMEEEGDESAKSYGRYNIRIALPENVQFDKMKTEVKDGVLYITIPKASNSSKVYEIHVE